MASGYEKDACGVDPNKGWDTPERRDRLLALALVVLAAVFVWGGVLVAVWSVMR